MKPLLVLPSARDIPEVKESVSRLQIDKIWIKYHLQQEAYETARQWFLNSDYTHFIIHPDDLLVTPYDLQTLLSVQSFEDDRIYSGWCINTIRESWEQDNQASFSYTGPTGQPHSTTYDDFNFIPVPDVEQLLREGKSIVKVRFSGFVLQSIPRAVIQQVPFRSWNDCCTDAFYSSDLAAQNIGEYVNLRVRARHLRRKPEEVQTGRKEKAVIIE